MNAPERIWCHPTERQPVPAKDKKHARWIRGAWKDHDSNAHGDVEYIRADLVDHAAIREAALREAAETARKIVECCQSCASVEIAILTLIDKKGTKA